jgi:hypothetical protein
MVSEELRMKNALNGFRGATDGGCILRLKFLCNQKGHPPLVAPLKPLRAFSVGNSSETIKDILRL